MGLVFHQIGFINQVRRTAGLRFCGPLVRTSRYRFWSQKPPNADHRLLHEEFNDARPPPSSSVTSTLPLMGRSSLSLPDNNLLQRRWQERNCILLPRVTDDDNNNSSYVSRQICAIWNVDSKILRQITMWEAGAASHFDRPPSYIWIPTSKADTACALLSVALSILGPRGGCC